MRLCCAVLKASLLAATLLATPTRAEPFHNGVNLSVAPGGANSSSEPLDVQQATNGRRLGEVVDIGFDFVRLRVALAPLDGYRIERRPAEGADPCERDHTEGACLRYAGRRGDDGRLAPDHDG
jgi:hypothetical protein